MYGTQKFTTLITMGAAIAATLIATAANATAAGPTAQGALALTPVQQNVEYDRPTKKETAGCTIKSEELGGRSGWVVRGAAGQLFRCFADTNGDNKVDQWCYYHNGIEAYRDLDTDFNGKADQYRWLGLNGTRWGVDANEDGRIDSWKTISAEEVTSEIVDALRNKDAARFATVLLTPTELRGLGLGKDASQKIGKSIETASRRFEQLSRSQRLVSRDSIWMHFGATRPGVLPKGTGGATRDVTVYENVVAMLEKANKAGQLPIGTLVKVGDSWRAIDVPVGMLSDEQSLASSSYLLQAAGAPAPMGVVDGNDEAIKKQQALAGKLEAAEAKLAKSKPGRERDAAYETVLNVYRELANNAAGNAAEQTSWIQQMADTLGTASQTGDFSKARERLTKLYTEVSKGSPKGDLTAYVKFRLMNANYAAELNGDKPDFNKIQAAWLEQLAEFVEDFPNCEDASEAMFDLAIGSEFDGDEKDAIAWYRKILKNGKKDSLVVRKADGAVTRLTAVGQPLVVSGAAINNQNRTFSTKNAAGRLVLVQYFATFSKASTNDITDIAKLYEEYGKQGFYPVSISVDSDRKDLDTYLRKAKPNWPVLYEEGGLDSRLATQLGILTVPTMILIDEKGKVVDRNIQVGQLDTILRKQLASKPKPRR